MYIMTNMLNSLKICMKQMNFCLEAGEVNLLSWYMNMHHLHRINHGIFLWYACAMNLAVGDKASHVLRGFPMDYRTRTLSTWMRAHNTWCGWGVIQHYTLYAFLLCTGLLNNENRCFSFQK